VLRPVETALEDILGIIDPAPEGKGSVIVSQTKDQRSPNVFNGGQVGSILDWISESWHRLVFGGDGGTVSTRNGQDERSLFSIGVVFVSLILAFVGVFFARSLLIPSHATIPSHPSAVSSDSKSSSSAYDPDRLRLFRNYRILDEVFPSEYRIELKDERTLRPVENANVFAHAGSNNHIDDIVFIPVKRNEKGYSVIISNNERQELARNDPPYRLLIYVYADGYEPATVEPPLGAKHFVVSLKRTAKVKQFRLLRPTIEREPRKPRSAR
jgi:hypothetical protein